MSDYDLNVIGIDPGKSGAIAWAYSSYPEAEVSNIPETRKDAIDMFREIVSIGPSVAYIEKISGYIPDGGASQMFEFGKQVERVGCILETLGCRIIEITPQSWMKALSLGKMDRSPIPRPPKGMSGPVLSVWKQQNAGAIQLAKAANARLKTEWKNKLKAEAQRRHPNIKVTLKNCDALLILEAGLLKERNQ